MEPTEEQIKKIFQNAPNNSVWSVFSVIEFSIVKQVIKYIIKEWEKIRS